MPFQRFNSIKHHDDKNEIQKWIKAHPHIEGIKFALTEKIDGTNMQVIINHDSIQFASRNKVLADKDQHFSWQKFVKDANMEKFKTIQKHIIANDVKTVNIYGELFGNKIMKRIDYATDGCFRVFEVHTDGKPLTFNQGRAFLFNAGIRDIEDWWVPVLTCPLTLKEALRFDVENITTRTGAKPSETSFIEGAVIIPSCHLIEMKHSDPESGLEITRRLALKSKAARFTKKNRQRKRKKTSHSEAYNKALSIWENMLCENRVLDAISKLGPMGTRNEIPKYSKFIIEDAKKDFIDRESATWESLSNAEKSALLRESNGIATMLIQSI